MMKKLTLFVTIILFSSVFLHAQTDPAKREDVAMERQRILKAADQIEMLNEQLPKMQQEWEALKKDIESLRTENYKIKQQMELAEIKRLKERDIILTEVAKSIVKVSKEKGKTEEKTVAAVAEKEKETQPAKAEKGYEHIVEKGQTLWLVSRAYKEKGIDVSVDDIRKANNLKPNAPLRIGQKLFIPQK